MAVWRSVTDQELLLSYAGAMRCLGVFLVVVTAVTACAEDEEPNACGDLSEVHSPTGSIRWTDGVVRLPDRIYVYREGQSEPIRECYFEPPESNQDAISFSCPEGYVGPATLSVLIDRERWDTPFVVEYEGCHAAPLMLDLELDPAAGESF